MRQWYMPTPLSVITRSDAILSIRDLPHTFFPQVETKMPASFSPYSCEEQARNRRHGGRVEFRAGGRSDRLQIGRHQQALVPRLPTAPEQATRRPSARKVRGLHAQCGGQRGEDRPLLRPLRRRRERRSLSAYLNLSVSFL